MTVLDRFLVHPVTLVAPAWTDNRYGDRVPDWAAATRTGAKGWFTATATTETLGDERDGITTTAELTLPAGAPIDASMRVERLGETWEIIGGVRKAETPAGTSHLVVALRKVDG